MDIIHLVELGATAFGLLQGVLVMLNKRANWIAYVIQMALMIVFSLSMHLYGDVSNSCIYLVLGVVGFIIWNKKGAKIESCKAIGRVGYCAVIALGTALMFNVLSATDDPLPLIDAFTTTSSFVATYLMMTKKIDTWVIWFVNDIFYAVEYFILPDQALGLFALNTIWTVFAVASFVNWYRIMKAGDDDSTVETVGE